MSASPCGDFAPALGLVGTFKLISTRPLRQAGPSQ
jgi:hypothetical protein